MLLIDPKNGQGELTTLESKASIFGLAGSSSIFKFTRPGDINDWIDLH